MKNTIFNVTPPVFAFLFAQQILRKEFTHENNHLGGEVFVTS